MAIRPEIQALRALAVTLVVVYHLWPSVLPGGFIGVDVFFAISGFLITSLLLREIADTGRVSLSRFWARRARRILPAALFTLAVCAAATVLVVPINLWPQFLNEVRASTLYVENWQLAADAGDYFARTGNTRSPVQHFWSLSVEEQFYLLWPVVLAAAATRRRTLIAALVAVTVLSFAYAVHATAGDPAAAYFLTPARTWEFGAGGLLAAAGVAARPSPALCVAGLATILAGALALSAATPFPGTAALLPVLGALATIRAGLAARCLAVQPLQFLGDHSYSIYLWHWPVLIFAPFVVAAPPRASLLALTLVLAWASKRLVEDPVRTLRALTPAWTFCGAGAATLFVLALVAGATTHVNVAAGREHRASQALLAAAPRCFGAAARDPEHPCENRQLRLRVVPTPLEAKHQRNPPCPVVERDGPLQVCAFGATAGDTIALVGDSHASHWRAALQVVARGKGWQGRSITHTGCPLSTAPSELPEPDRATCESWRRHVFAWFERHPEVRTVFISSLAGRAGDSETEVGGVLGAWQRLPATVERIVVLRDTPRVRGNTDVCVERAITSHRAAGHTCAVPRSLSRDPSVVAAARLDSERVHTINLTDFICDTRSCFPVVGGVLVFKDNNHLTSVFARSLAPYLQREIERVSTSG